MYVIHSSWVGPALAASAVASLLFLQVADFGLFALSATIRRVVWLAAAADWLIVIALVVLRFVVIA
jgi:hypothetical protein